MASKNPNNYPYRVKWRTELPYEYIPRRSPVIFLEGSKWNLELFINRRRNFSLKLASEKLNLKRMKVSSVIQDPSFKSSKINMSKLKLVDTPSKLYDIGEKSRKEIKEAIPNIFKTGILTIICVFKFSRTPLYKTHALTNSTLKNVDLESLSQDFSTFLKNETFPNVKLKCAGRTFFAKRSVLAARSGFFAAMFRNKMADVEIDVVQIKDMDPEILKIILQYMYSGQSPDLCEETAHLVYEMAVKYAIYGVGRACSDWMVEHQTTDNCLDLLMLAEDHSDDEFKKAVTCFVVEHLLDIDKESWSAFKKYYPLLAFSLLEKKCQDLMVGSAVIVR